MRIFISIIAVLFSQQVLGQDLSPWLGHYTGELKANNTSGKTSLYHMELIIETINDTTYKWIIIYGNEADSNRQERNYLLRRTAQKNHFIIDEQNSILLDLDLIGNSLFSIFEVQGNLMVVEYQRKEDKILFLLKAGYGRSETGNTTQEGEKIPMVYSYKTAAVQSAILHRKK